MFFFSPFFFVARYSIKRRVLFSHLPPFTSLVFGFPTSYLKNLKTIFYSRGYMYVYQFLHTFFFIYLRLHTNVYIGNSLSKLLLLFFLWYASRIRIRKLLEYRFDLTKETKFSFSERTSISRTKILCRYVYSTPSWLMDKMTRILALDLFDKKKKN